MRPSTRVARVGRVARLQKGTEVIEFVFQKPHQSTHEFRVWIAIHAVLGSAFLILNCFAPRTTAIVTLRVCCGSSIVPFRPQSSVMKIVAILHSLKLHEQCGKYHSVMLEQSASPLLFATRITLPCSLGRRVCKEHRRIAFSEMFELSGFDFELLSPHVFDACHFL